MKQNAVILEPMNKKNPKITMLTFKALHKGHMYTVFYTN